MENPAQLIGQTFGRWLVTKHVGSDKHRRSLVECVCSCPKKTVKIIATINLRLGKSKSCGCLYEETRSTCAKTHGLYRDPIYQCWNGMMQRCYNPKHRSYPRYGGAGVVVAKEWHDLPTFKAYMGVRPVMNFHSLDRFPNKFGNYEPGNLRWATREQQQRNMKSNVYLTLGDQRKTIAEWTQIKGWHRSKIKNRRYAGWSDEEILTTP